MKTDIFPQVFYDEQQSAIELKKEQARRRYQEKQDRYINEKPKKADENLYEGVGAVIGLIVGFFACVSICKDNDTIKGFFCSIGAWFGIFLAGMVISSILAERVEKEQKKKEKQIQEQITEEHTDLQKELLEIEIEAKKEQTAYYQKFEDNAQEMSVRFVESALTKEIVDWMKDEFYSAIDEADRSSHIEKITVRFHFEVYKDRITCGRRTYDFKEQRCENLSTNLEQAALARAIASSLRMGIMMQYPVDASGTGVTVDIDRNYTTAYAEAVIDYVAPNGNYVTVKKW